MSEMVQKKKVDNDGILWINLKEITSKYISNHRKHRYELVEEPKEQDNIILQTKHQQLEELWIVEQNQLINLGQD